MGKIMNSIFSWLRRHARVVVLFLFVLGIAPAYLHAYQLTPGGVSEVPTLLPRDIIIVNHAAYHLRFPYSNVALFRTGSPKRGEMVLIILPNNQGVAPKRVMGLPGDTIELRDNRLIINSNAVSATPLPRPYFAWVPEEDKMGSVIENEEGHRITYTPGKGQYPNHPATPIASGEYFVIGDNRDESADSRVWGPISESSIVGKVTVKLPTGHRRRTAEGLTDG
jgi:signal peptidase I